MQGEVRLSSGLSAAISLGYLPEQRVARGNSDVRLGTTLGTLGVVHRTALGNAFSFVGSVALVVGAMHIVVVDPLPVDPGQRAWGASAWGVGLGFDQGPMTAQLGVDALLRFARRSYFVEHPSSASRTSIFDEPTFATIGSLSVGVRY